MAGLKDVVLEVLKPSVLRIIELPGSEVPGAESSGLHGRVK